MDTASIETLGSAPLLLLLQELNDLYPANPPDFSELKPSKSDPDDPNEFSKTLGFLESIGVKALIAFKLDVCIFSMLRVGSS